MKATLTIQEKLKDLRVERRLSLDELAKLTGIGRSTLGDYEKEDKDISHTNLLVLARFYDVSADYLIGQTENKNHPNTELAALRLSDEMVELLKSRRINNRLLCEMAVHKDFVKLLADVEIYVDGIAGMQIQNLNAYVNLARDMVEKKYSPGDGDRHVRMLDAAHINEDDYFQSIVHNDLDGIMRDMKEAHRGDRESAPESDFAEELKRDLKYVSSIEGNDQKRQAILYCRRLEIDYTKLTDVEFEVLMRVLKKSKLLKRQGKSRKRKRK